MPGVLLPVPHFDQSRDGACLPACARMVLAFWGEKKSETAVARQLQSKRFGTPIGNAVKLEAWHYHVEVGKLNRTDLENHLTNGQPIIARVWTPMLDYWKVETSHVVVVAGFDEGFVYLNDPAFAVAPQTVLWDAFLAAWAEYDETAVRITPL